MALIQLFAVQLVIERINKRVSVSLKVYCNLYVCPCCNEILNIDSLWLWKCKDSSIVVCTRIIHSTGAKVIKTKHVTIIFRKIDANVCIGTTCLCGVSMTILFHVAELPCFCIIIWKSLEAIPIYYWNHKNSGVIQHVVGLKIVLNVAVKQLYHGVKTHWHCGELSGIVQAVYKDSWALYDLSLPYSGVKAKSKHITWGFSFEICFSHIYFHNYFWEVIQNLTHQGLKRWSRMVISHTTDYIALKHVAFFKTQFALWFHVFSDCVRSCQHCARHCKKYD